jgi:hypothetical protein
MSDDDTFDTDARHRIALRIGGTLAQTLAPAIDQAGAQLELSKPAVTGMTPRGFVAGSAVAVQLGVVLIVLANPRKVLTLQMFPPPKGTRLDAVQDCIRYVTAHMDGREIEPAACMLAIEDAIDKHGGKPGKRTRQLSQEHCRRLIGVLFSVVSKRARLFHAIEQMIGDGICPAIIGVVGPGSRDGLAAVWPIVFALAPYLDHLFPAEPRQTPRAVASS